MQIKRGLLKAAHYDLNSSDFNLKNNKIYVNNSISNKLY